MWFLLFYWLSPLGLQQTLGTFIVKCFFPSHFTPYLHHWTFSKTHLHLQATSRPTALPIPYTIISLDIPSHTVLNSRCQWLHFLALLWYRMMLSSLHLAVFLSLDLLFPPFSGKVPGGCFSASVITAYSFFCSPNTAVFPSSFPQLLY